MKEAMKLALEALKITNDSHDWTAEGDAAIKALEEALAKQEQGEPFGWVDTLDIENIEPMFISHQDKTQGSIYSERCKHQIYTTSQSKQEQGEPVAWMFQHEDTGLTDCVDSQQVEWGFEKNNPRWQKIGPLYTTPQQRTWVGLTESDRRLINFQWQDGNGTATEIIDLVEAKLKEKNT
jgi:hypothetical protein